MKKNPNQFNYDSIKKMADGEFRVFIATKLHHTETKVNSIDKKLWALLGSMLILLGAILANFVMV